MTKPIQEHDLNTEIGTWHSTNPERDYRDMRSWPSWLSEILDRHFLCMPAFPPSGTVSSTQYVSSFQDFIVPFGGFVSVLMPNLGIEA